ncbi:ribonuclease H-like domain-containing protein [Bisporella sp. PMI_857]|nr:ribonuclease H-like domain-containing protein [Bisporella sp. PMI_857]
MAVADLPIFFTEIEISPARIEHLTSNENRLYITCMRCMEIIQGDHYYCHDCPLNSDNICAGCASAGLYCPIETHNYVKQSFSTHGNSRYRVGQPIGSKEARAMLSRFPRNGQDDPQAGFCFVYRPSVYSQAGKLTQAGTVSSRLEESGPTGQIFKPTSNRAELRAVIAALQFRDWFNDCNRSWRSIVIATDSEYVALGATQWVKHWESNGWRTYDQKTQRVAIKNQDLWRLLMVEIRKLQSVGVCVSFWRVPRQFNQRADQFAKQACGRAVKINFEVITERGPVTLRFEPY